MSDEKITTPELNLLVEDELDMSPQGKFLKWALSWGKKIIVTTELVVISAFLSRFWLDTTVANLNEEISTKRAYVLSFADFEKRYRQLYFRVGQAESIEKATSTQIIYDRALALIPPGVVVVQVNINKLDVGIAGNSDETNLAKLVDAFRASADFTSISVERIAKKTNSPGVDFAFKATYGRG